MSESKWYYIDGQKQVGPLSTAQLKEAAAAGKVVARMWIWKPGLKDWVPAYRAVGLFPANAVPPPLPTPVPVAPVVQPIPVARAVYAAAPAYSPPPSYVPAYATVPVKKPWLTGSEKGLLGILGVLVLFTWLLMSTVNFSDASSPQPRTRQEREREREVEQQGYVPRPYYGYAPPSRGSHSSSEIDSWVSRPPEPRFAPNQQTTPPRYAPQPWPKADNGPCYSCGGTGITKTSVSGIQHRCFSCNGTGRSR